MKATAMVTYDEAKDPREVEQEFRSSTGTAAAVTYVGADINVWRSMTHLVETFETRWVYELEWDV